MFCSKCGAQNSDVAIFCITCGTNLKNIKKENWFNRHLNWTWFIALASVFVFAIVVGIFAAVIDPYYDPYSEYGMFDVIIYLYYFVVMISVSIWVLIRKNRSLAWIFLIGWFSPLWLANKRKVVIDPPKVL